jgi:hypothetical protein
MGVTAAAAVIAVGVWRCAPALCAPRRLGALATYRSFPSPSSSEVSLGRMKRDLLPVWGKVAAQQGSEVLVRG